MGVQVWRLLLVLLAAWPTHLDDAHEWPCLTKILVSLLSRAIFGPQWVVAHCRTGVGSFPSFRAPWKQLLRKGSWKDLDMSYVACHLVQVDQLVGVKSSWLGLKPSAIWTWVCLRRKGRGSCWSGEHHSSGEWLVWSCWGVKDPEKEGQNEHMRRTSTLVPHTTWCHNTHYREYLLHQLSTPSTQCDANRV